MLINFCVEYAKYSLFLYYYFLIILLFSIGTTINLLLLLPPYVELSQGFLLILSLTGLVYLIRWISGGKSCIAEINIFEVSGVDSSESHNSVINILWFSLKFQNTEKYYYVIQKLSSRVHGCVCVYVCMRLNAVF